MSFYDDRVELCDVDICSGDRSERHRAVLDLLRAQIDTAFVVYSGEELADRLKIKPKNVGGVIRNLRTRISRALQEEAFIDCDRYDVILSGGPGYRFSDCLSVQLIGVSETTDIAGLSSNINVRDVRDRNVRDVRDSTPEMRQAWICQQLSAGKQVRAQDVVTEFNCTKKTAERDFKVLKEKKKSSLWDRRRRDTIACVKPRKRRHNYADNRITLVATTVSESGENAASIQAAINGSNECQSPRLFFQTSPSASMSKGFLIVGQRLTPSREKFKQVISRIRRFAELSATTFGTFLRELSTTSPASSGDPVTNG